MPVHSGFHTRGYLPHLKVGGATYFVTFRLADSLPREILDRLDAWRADQLRRATGGEAVALDEQMSAWIDEQLDRGSGACWLRDERVAALVADALRHFDGERYRLPAGVVMPNHVHALVQPLPGFALEGILHSWKSFTAHAANKLLGRDGEFWQRESYDHWVRDEAEAAHYRRYIEDNPVAARLCARADEWKWSSATGAGRK
jgi:REP element-mobilizing transposase RayT